MTLLDDFLSQLSEAEAHALVDHRAGRCYLSEWSCTYCEAEEAASGHQAPCPSWCDGTHPDPGGQGNVAHVRSVNGIGLEWVTNDNGSRSSVRVRWSSPTSIMSRYFGADGLRQLARDAGELASQVESLEHSADLSDPKRTV